MDLFTVLQVLFDAVLLFGVLFLFHYSVHQTQKKKEETDILKNAQVQEIKENLQELLMTLKQLGKEVSDNIQEQVKEAEEKTEAFKKAVAKLKKDLPQLAKLAEEVGAEKTHLEDKLTALGAARKHGRKGSAEGRPEGPTVPEPKAGAESKDGLKGFVVPPGEGLGFEPGVVKEVYRLSDAKTQMNEIVRKTQLSRAEIQLILNLRGNGFTASN